MTEKSTEPICHNCGQPGDQCGCEPCGMFDPATINWRKCEVCGALIPDDCRLCDDCAADVMLLAHIRDQEPS